MMDVFCLVFVCPQFPYTEYMDTLSPNKSAALTPEQEVRYIAGVGPAVAAKLATLDIRTIRDLLYHIPIGYEDLGQLRDVSTTPAKVAGAFAVDIHNVHVFRTPRKGWIVTEASGTNNGAHVKLVWFHQPYLVKKINAGSQVWIYGAHDGGTIPIFTNPSLIQETDIGTLQPKYPLRAGVTQLALRKYIHSALQHVVFSEDPIPESVRTQYHLCDLESSLRSIHFPNSLADATQARRRLSFQELLYVQLSIRQSRRVAEQERAPSVPYHHDAFKGVVDALPFTLTDEQRKILWAIVQDIGRPTPMMRLLQGDVGSGKTVIATMAAYHMALHEYQTAILAPTEILAMQHGHSIAQLLRTTGLTIGVLTGATGMLYTGGTAQVSTPKDVRKLLSEGNIHIAVGTHALLEKNTSFSKLGLAVVDEQHRFGVSQRSALKSKTQGYTPHFLSLSATPIPRSLQLALYGDVTISSLHTKPQHRAEIRTQQLGSITKTVLAHIQQEVAADHRVYIVCPSIEEESESAAVLNVYKNMVQLLPGIPIGMVHGKMNSQEKHAAIESLRSGATPVCVATTVIEVGMDISNATLMVILDAERFGLAQLHQLRGRIGRSTLPSWCYAISTAKNNPRLQAFCSTTDGFRIAELDLKLRGPGEITGTRQSGDLNISIANLDDVRLLTDVTQAAEKLSGHINHFPLLEKEMYQWQRSVHWE